MRVVAVIARFGDRVETRRAEGPTTTQTTDTEPGAPPGTILLHGLFGVFGARRREAARRRPTLSALLIPNNALEQERFHNEIRDWRSTTLVRRRAKDTSWAGRVRPNKYRPGGSVTPRRASRHRRRARLRSTAIPDCRPIAKATRGPSSEGSTTMVHQRTPLRTRVPSRRSRANSSRPWRRPIKPTAACDPSGAGP